MPSVIGLLACLGAGSFSSRAEGRGAEALMLWYDKPAMNWQKEALPIGNGRLGAMLG